MSRAALTAAFARCIPRRVTPDLEPKVTLSWLIRLRWLSTAAQIAALAVARWVLDVEVSTPLLLAAAGVTLASNVALARMPRSRPGSSVPGLLGVVLALDVALLTVVLAASGGPMNPFTVLYLVHITLSAIALSASWTTLIGALSVAGFGLLFLLTPADPHAHHRHGAALGHHLEGMWVAFVLAAGLTAFFVRRVVQAIAGQREQIAALREASARNAKLAALTTLAAGAAHELGSPLGTIAVAAHEAELAAARLQGNASVLGDLKLIQLEVERCREILSQMAARAAETREGPKPLVAGELAERIRAELGSERSRRVEMALEADLPGLRVPFEPLTQSVVALIKNAVDASSTSSSVSVRSALTGEHLSISVVDQGPGIPKAILDRIGEPFFTTKEPGRGIGLGVFLARTFAESQGGALTIESQHGNGTRAELRLPLPAGAA